MEYVPDISHQKHKGQAAQYLGSVGSHNRRNQTEHTDGAQFDDEGHNRDGHIIGTLHKVSKYLSLLSRHNGAEAKEQRHHNHLKHGCLSHRLDDIAGEYTNQCLDKTRCFCCRILQRAGGQHRKSLFEQVRNQKAQSDRKKGSAHIIDDGFTSNASHLLNILHGNNTVHDGEQDNGNYDEFQQVQKQGAKGLDVNFRNVRPAHQQHACHNT